MDRDIKPIVRGGHIVEVPNLPEHEEQDTKVRVVIRDENAIIAPPLQTNNQQINSSQLDQGQQSYNVNQPITLNHMSQMFLILAASMGGHPEIGAIPEISALKNLVNDMEELKAKLSDEINTIREERITQEQFNREQRDITVEMRRQREEIKLLNNIMRDTILASKKQMNDLALFSNRITADFQKFNQEHNALIEKTNTTNNWLNMNISSQLEKLSSDIRRIAEAIQTSLPNSLHQIPGNVALTFCETSIPPIGVYHPPSKATVISNSPRVSTSNRNMEHIVLFDECPFCQQNDHGAADCTKYRTITGRQTIARKKGLCVCCLKKHEQPCNNRTPCPKCFKCSHNVALCGHTTRTTRTPRSTANSLGSAI